MLADRKSNVYRDLFLRHPQPMWVYELASLRFLEVNDAACVAYGFSRAQMLRMTIEDIRPEEDRKGVAKFVRESGNTSGPVTLRRHQRADGTIFYVDITATPFIFEKKPARIVLAVDASARVAVSRALTDSRAALGEAQELAHLGSFDSDLVTGEMRWSAELYRIYGIDPARERPRVLYEFVHPEDRAAVIGKVERARLDGSEFTSEHRIVRGDGAVRHVVERGRFFYENGKAGRVVGAVLDITERKLAEDRLRNLAQHDALTGLANRTLLMSRLAEELQASAARGEKLGVVFIDLDRFKAINDTIAHAAGDEVLCRVAARIVETVGRYDIVGRPGGDEFVILLPGVDDETTAVATAYELLARIGEPIEYEQAQVVVTASAGISVFPEDGTLPAELLRNADTAMYAAKARGGNSVEVFRPALHVAVVAELELERALRGALEREGITVNYQPIVDAVDGRVVAFEALARWQENGLAIEPNSFIPLAEATGLIVRLGTYVLNCACREIRRLRDLGFTDIVMCVNISARQFREFDFAGRVRSALQAANIPASALELEITESAYISVDSGVRNMRELEEMGVRLSIDDFGTGYSSLGYLKRLPVNTVKIDRSFVADILVDHADQAIVRAIIAVAQNLNLVVIAEGVETIEHVRFLRDLGCTHLQGYFFSRAMPPTQLESYLRQPTAL